ncbi:Os09g0357300 [Oryza sativa Japonica Group]|uniref:Os09g0357300 protein n=1 Tax=Oryza sativa subsp. japonica TaxID=39947 RepID=Q0J2D1_ORYSJ|nr:Os09g0357300 [Oryza sativa Japonica Group]|eukprot:NP_001062970.1 Os09g0357300 [Oryza sativa Japonica Group]
MKWMQFVNRFKICLEKLDSPVQSLNVQNWVPWHHLHCFLGQLNATKLQGLTFLFVCAMSQSNEGINFLFIVVQFWFCLIIWEKGTTAYDQVSYTL